MKIHPGKLLLLLALPAGLAAEAVVWENADFENALDPWTVQRGNIAPAAEAAHGGQGGARIEASESATLNSPPVPIDGLRRYRLQFWIRGVEQSHASIMLGFDDGSGRAMNLENADTYKKALPTGKEWREFSFDFTPPESATFLHVKLGVWPKKDASGTDTVDVDDFRLTELPDAP